MRWNGAAADHSPPTANRSLHQQRQPSQPSDRKRSPKKINAVAGCSNSTLLPSSSPLAGSRAHGLTASSTEPSLASLAPWEAALAAASTAAGQSPCLPRPQSRQTTLCAWPHIPRPASCRPKQSPRRLLRPYPTGGGVFLVSDTRTHASCRVPSRCQTERLHVSLAGHGIPHP